MTAARAQFLRFLVAGLVNTGATYLLYLLLLPYMHYLAAYSVTYLAGIVLSFLLNARFVFEVAPTLRRLLLFPLVYVVQYATGAAVLHAAVVLFGVPRELAMAAAIAASVPLTFVAGKWLLTHKWTQGN
jgi:putative flippase GtrA